jgi:carbonic anhydrase
MVDAKKAVYNIVFICSYHYLISNLVNIIIKINSIKNMKRSLIVFAVFCFLVNPFIYAQDGRTITKEIQQSYTPADVLKLLKDGNKRFVDGKPLERNLYKQVKETSKGQYPVATVLSCMDSRNPTEIVLDNGIGDIFNIGVAGNVVNSDILGSMEYGSKVVGVKLILVLGHTDCGAVKGAIDDVEMGNLTQLLEKIEPAAKTVKYEGERTSKNKEFVELVTKENVMNAMNYIRNNSAILKEMEDSGQIDIVGGMYDVSTGVITFYE